MKEQINPGLAKLARPMAGLRPDPKNARKHSPDQLARIAESLKAFGQQKAIVVLKDGTVAGGNGLYLAAVQLGWKRIAAVTFDGKNARRFKIADNRTAELAEWDDGMLAKALKQIGGSGVSIAAAGFTQAEFDLVLAQASQALPTGEGIPEEKPPAWSENVRMVQLVMDADGHEKFMANVRKLSGAWKTTHVTETVFDAMRRAALD